jgi:FKBP-type peptidyl-prolyl cis-trans isomerase 2
MAAAKHGDSVQVHYTGTLQDGTVFDSSRSRQPLRFKLGSGQVIAGFEKAVTGMLVGESKTVSIPPEEAYGQRRDDRIVTLRRNQLPANLNVTVGQRLELTQEDDQAFLATVSDITPELITLDANHPLAGKTLTFELELVGIF